MHSTTHAIRGDAPSRTRPRGAAAFQVGRIMGCAVRAYLTLVPDPARCPPIVPGATRRGPFGLATPALHARRHKPWPWSARIACRLRPVCCQCPPRPGPTFAGAFAEAGFHSQNGRVPRATSDRTSARASRPLLRLIPDRPAPSRPSLRARSLRPVRAISCVSSTPDVDSCCSGDRASRRHCVYCLLSACSHCPGTKPTRATVSAPSTCGPC